ncbi:MAG: sodium:solute symporter family protein [Gammaproteobacteria bacterium]|jgi:SSS family solute:Na+ symporter|nr:sodium:solute symporter family protein [Gammaproteobacteria bacterium]
MIWALCIGMFSLFILWLGLRASHGIKDIKQYLVSHQSFGSFALFSTIVASFVGAGVVMGTAQKAFQFGIGHALGLLGFGLQLFLTGWWVAPRMAKFRHMITLGEVIEKYYGKVPQILTGILWLSFCIGILTAQMSAMGNLVSSLLGYDRAFCILLSAGLVIFYCYVGGIRAVVATDIVQLVLMLLAIVLVAICGIHYVGGWQSLMESIPSSHLLPTSHLSGWDLGFVFMSFLLGDALIPPVFQRLLMGKNEKITRKAYMSAGLLVVPICFLVMIHGLVAYCIDPAMVKENITANLFESTLAMPFAIIALIGFISVIMSSADSYLNAAAGSLVNDVIVPMSGKPLDTSVVLGLAKWTTVILGVCSTFFAIAVQDILDILLKTYQFWGPTLVVPLIGIFSNKTLPPWGFYACVLTGGLTVVTWNTFDLETTTHVTGLIVGMMANAIVYVSAYGLTKHAMNKKSVFT